MNDFVSGLHKTSLDRLYEITFSKWFQQAFKDGVYSPNKRLTSKSVRRIEFSDEEAAELLNYVDESPSFERVLQEEIINLRASNIKRVKYAIRETEKSHQHSLLSVEHQFIFFECAYNTFAYADAVYGQLKKMDSNGEDITPEVETS